MMSGSTSKWSIPNHLPVRPKPLITSSAISTMSYLSHSSRSVRQYAGAGTYDPFAVEIGSAIIAAIVSGPCARI